MVGFVFMVSFRLAIEVYCKHSEHLTVIGCEYQIIPSFVTYFSSIVPSVFCVLYILIFQHQFSPVKAAAYYMLCILSA